MDEATGEALGARLSLDDEFAEALVQEMGKVYRKTWSWASLSPEPGEVSNLLCFHSGWGDGFYPSYAGITASGSVCVVVTDLAVFNLPKATADAGAV